ncbi:MAG: Ig-like domain-containing protein [Dysgonamonadaceae bacterium]|nr:Ig-like domain-containing protein [Dysgonamonadaceae bacterium]
MRRFCLFFFFALPALAGIFYACASRMDIGGGDYDIEPPKFRKSLPAPNSVRYDKNKIELDFDEYITIQKPTEKVIITPPQSRQPQIKAVGKKITVELRDTLIPNTTYTFDFTNAIVDNNESNAIEGFSFAFSTGDVLDSLSVSGILLDALTLEPMKGIMVGLHNNLDDTAFTSIPFLRTTMTDDRGQFHIRNAAYGSYKVYALADKNRNFRFDQKTEDIAFLDSIFVPSFEPAVRQDTVWIDSLTIDTIKEVHYNRFTPDDIVLRLFHEEGNEQQYLSKQERAERHKIAFHFNSGAGLPPEIRLTNSDLQERENWYIPEISPDKKDITYWLTDSLVYQKDTLWIETKYLKTDTLDNLQPAVDTLRFVWRDRKEDKDKDKKNRRAETLRLDFQKTSSLEVYDTIRFTASEPLLNFDADKIVFSQKVDTLWERRKFPIVGDTLNPRSYYIDKRWDYGQEFRFSLDSAAFSSIYGKTNDSIDTRFKFAAEETYAVLFVKIIGRDSLGVCQLLNSTDAVVRSAPLIEGYANFEDLKPGKYYLRFFEDDNGNGIWDTGNYAEHRQPEKVYYYNSSIELREYQEVEQEWDLNALPTEKQKPLEITKNKPEQKKAKRSRDEERKQQSSKSGTNQSGGFSSGSVRSLPGLR